MPSELSLLVFIETAFGQGGLISLQGEDLECEWVLNLTCRARWLCEGLWWDVFYFYFYLGKDPWWDVGVDWSPWDTSVSVPVLEFGSIQQANSRPKVTFQEWIDKWIDREFFHLQSHEYDHLFDCCILSGLDNRAECARTCPKCCHLINQASAQD
jgi:hypothetical protein